MPRRRSRYREAMARRAADQKKSDRAVAATTQVASFAVLIAFAVTIVAVLEGPAGFAPLAPFTRDVLGPFSWLEIAGFGFGVWISFVMWKRLRK